MNNPSVWRGISGREPTHNNMKVMDSNSSHTTVPRGDSDPFPIGEGCPSGTGEAVGSVTGSSVVEGASPRSSSKSLRVHSPPFACTAGAKTRGKASAKITFDVDLVVLVEELQLDMGVNSSSRCKPGPRSSKPGLRSRSGSRSGSGTESRSQSRDTKRQATTDREEGGLAPQTHEEEEDADTPLTIRSRAIPRVIGNEPVDLDVIVQNPNVTLNRLGKDEAHSRGERRDVPRYLWRLVRRSILKKIGQWCLSRSFATKGKRRENQGIRTLPEE